MTPDLDTLLIALYVEIDDHVTCVGRRRPGHPKRLTDAELVCLAGVRTAGHTGDVDRQAITSPAGRSTPPKAAVS